MKIEVTLEDIEKGRPKNCESCPIALALQRAFGWPILVGNDEWWRSGGEITESSFQLLPAEARRFINQFDSGKLVEPFSFEVFYDDAAIL